MTAPTVTQHKEDAMSTPIGNVNLDDPTGALADAFADVDYVFDGFTRTPRGEIVANAHKSMGEVTFRAQALGIRSNTQRDAAATLYKTVTRTSNKDAR